MTVGNNQSQEIKIDDCWNHIGVQGSGDRSCSKLQNVIHCRNCDNFILAARQLLDRSPLSSYKQNRYTKSPSESVEENKSQTIVIFRIGSQWFGLSPKYFHAVIKWNGLHSIPHNLSKKIKGLVAISGELQLCVALEHLLGIEEDEAKNITAKNESYERMVVLSGVEEKYVFPVNEIRDIYHYSASELSEPPATVSINSQNVVYGVLNWNDKYVSCLDFKLLRDLIEDVFE